MLFTTALIVVRNQRILAARNTRQEETQRRAAAGLPRKPANAAARPSPASPPGRPDRNRHDTSPRPSPPARTAPPTRPEHTLTQDKTSGPGPGAGPKTRHRTTGCQQARMSVLNVKIGLTET
jgi:hypothetical protein